MTGNDLRNIKEQQTSKVIPEKTAKCAWCGKEDLKDNMQETHSNDEFTCDDQTCFDEYHNSRGII